MKLTKTLIAMTTALAAMVGHADSGDSSPFLLDTAEGTRIAAEGEAIPIAYSPHWNGAASCTVVETGKAALVAAATDEGAVSWAPQGVGGHTLAHTAGGDTLTAQFAVLGDDVEIHAGPILSSEVWDTNKVHLVVAPVIVGDDYDFSYFCELEIQAGAVVKFMPGTGISIKSNAYCTASGAIFTHVNDDTIGGDTLMDGDATMPVMDDYQIPEMLIWDDSVEIRYHFVPTMNVTLSGTVSADETWRGHNVYCVTGNLTVASGKTLTIMPGAIVKFADDQSLTVNGTLNAQGTRAAPIVFTSLKDDEHGGDTNGDADKTYPQPGDWVKICINGGTANFNYAKILYSSKNATTGAINMTSSGGRIVFANGEIAHAAYDAIGVESGNCYVTNSVIHDCLLAFRHWARDPIVNCVIYDCGRLTQGGGQHFYNCIFSRIIETWEAFGFPQNGTTYRNCCFWNENGSVLTAEGRQDAKTVCGKNGNIWANPRFLDPENGDFRIAANSPCINAGDAAYAPKFDYYGQPRDGAPDIGIYEVVSETGYDLAAATVSSIGSSPVQGEGGAQAARSTIGDTITISYTVANVGREAVADPWHDAFYLVSSSSGKQYVLGEPLNPGGLGAGESRTCTARFAVPAVPVGQYRLRLVVNSRRMDVPEGAAMENNVVVSEDEIEIAANSVDASEGASGSVAAGASAVCAFNIPEGSGDKLLRITATSGGTSLSARGGLGFLPVDASSGIALSFSGGAAWLSVPAGTEKVWLVLDNAGALAATYTVDFHDGALALVGVSPSSIPSSGNVTVEIEGAGFTDDCEVSFTGTGTVAPLAIRRVSSGLLAVTVDASAFGAGSTYAVTVRKGDESKTMENALAVEKAPGKPKFWAKLDVPGSMRQGRLVQTCYIEYGNSGTADMASPVLQVSLTGDGTLGYIDGLSGLKALQFIAAGEKGSAGVLRPGSSHRIRFAVRAGAGNKISLHTSEGSNYAPAPWTNATDYLADLSAAATRAGNCGLDATDYEVSCDIAGRTLTNNIFSIVSGTLYASDGEKATRCFLTLSGSNNVYYTQTDDMGRFCFDNVQAGNYVIASQGVGMIEGGEIFVGDNADVSGVELYISSTENCVLTVEGFDSDYRVSLSNATTGDEYFFSKNLGTYSVSGLPYGRYIVSVSDSSGGLWRGGFTVDESSVKTVLLAEREGPSSIVGVVDLPVVYPGRVVLLSYSDHCEYEILDEDQDSFNFVNLPSGYYTVEVFCGNDDEIIHETIDSFYLESGITTNLTYAVSKSASSFSRVKALSTRKLGGSYGDKYHWWQPNAVQNMFLDYLKEFEDEWFANRVYRPQGEYACEHNLAKYERDVALWQSYQDLIIKYHQSATKTSAWKFLADCSWLVHKLGDLSWDAFMYVYCKGTTTVYKMALRDVAANFATFMVTDFAESVLLGKDGHKITEQELNALNATIQSAANASGTVDDILKKARLVQYSIQSLFGENMWSNIGYHSKFMKGPVGKMLNGLNDVLTFGQDFIDTYYAGKQVWDSMNELDDAMDQMEQLTWLLTESRIRFNQQAKSFNQYPLCCNMCYPEQPYDPPVDNKTPNVPKSCDPNEMVGEDGVGDARYVKPGQELTYTIYFENKAGFDIADAQEVRVTNPFSEWLDWNTFEMRESAFGNQSDVALDGLAYGASEVQMDGTNKYVRTTVEYDAETGVATWYMRVYDPNGDSEGYPTDGSGFLPSNDDTHRGEGHITYRIKVREDAPANVVITNSASIVFDLNDPIETDPAWWNTVGSLGAQFSAPEVVADEGGAAEIRVSGGNADAAASVKVFLTYNTAAAADVDLAKGTVSDAAERVPPVGGSPSLATAKGLKFPVTLTWAAGEIGEKVIAIPIKTAKAVEGDEFFTLQLADAQGMELGEERVCVVTIHDPGYDELAAKVAAGTATAAELKAWDKLQKAKAPYIRGLADSAERGKVSGSGLCAAGKKVTLKASANKGFVFTGWCQGTGNGEQGTGMPGFDERLQKGAVEYVATTPSLVIDRSAKPAKDSATSTTITNVNEDATFYACFITSAEDKAAIAASVDGLILDPWVSKTETHAFATNIWAGVYLEWPVAASALAATTVKVAGLPAGLKFAAKPVTSKIGTGKNAVTVTNVQANTIYGAPTAASKTDKKTNAAKPSEVKVTVTTAGKSSQTYQIDAVVDALPSWAQGAFSGGVLGQGTGNGEQGTVEVAGQVSLTIDAKGKVSGKALGDGLTYTLAAPYYSGFEAIDDGEGVSSNFLADVTANWSYKEGSKTIKTNDVVYLTVQDNGIGGVATGSFDAPHAPDPNPQALNPKPYLSAWQYNWKAEQWETLGKKFDKQTQTYAILSDGSFSENEDVLTSALCADVVGRVTLKFAASGAVSVSGEFVTGYNEGTKRYTTVKATGSATLVPVDDEHGEVFIYLTPKGLPPHARCLSVPW